MGFFSNLLGGSDDKDPGDESPPKSVLVRDTDSGGWFRVFPVKLPGDEDAT